MLKDFSKIHTLNKKKVNTRMNAFEILKQIYMNYDNVFILESLTGPRELSEFSVIGFDPEFTVKCDRSRFQVFRKEKMICDKQVVDPLVELRKIIPIINE